MKRFTVPLLVCFTFRMACRQSAAAEDAPAGQAIKIELSQEPSFKGASLTHFRPTHHDYKYAETR